MVTDLAVVDAVWVRGAAVEPLDELAPAWIRDEYRPDVLQPFVEANTFDGSLVAVQAEVDVAGLWYRRSALDDLGVAVPRTWMSWRSAAAALAGAGVRSPIVLPGGSRAGETTAYCLLALLAANGVAVFTGDAVTLDVPGAVEMPRLSAATRRRRRGSRAKSPPTRPIGRSGCWPRPARAFCFGGSYEALALQRAAGDDEDVWRLFGFAPIPRGPRGGYDTLAGGMVHAVFRQAANPLLAVQADQPRPSPRRRSPRWRIDARANSLRRRSVRSGARRRSRRCCSPTRRRGLALTAARPVAGATKG